MRPVLAGIAKMARGMYNGAGMGELNSTLPFHDLSERHDGLTEALATCYHEAARVCLGRHHKPPAMFVIQDGAAEMKASAVWEPADDRCRAAHANEITGVLS